MWLVYRDIKLQVTRNKVRKTQDQLSFSKASIFKIHGLHKFSTEILDNFIRIFFAN